MKITDQVCSLDQARELHELGVRCESLFYWVKKNPDSDSMLMDQEELTLSIENCRRYPWDNWPAYTCAELGVMLPEKVGEFTLVLEKLRTGFEVSYASFDNGKLNKWLFTGHIYHLEAQARASALIWLIKEGHIKAEEVKL